MRPCPYERSSDATSALPASPPGSCVRQGQSVIPGLAASIPIIGDTKKVTGHFGPAQHHDARRVAAAATKTRKPRGRSQQLAREELPIDSPSGARRRGGRPRGDELFRDGDPDPHDERILITVKEAAWRLSLTKNAIREAVRSGDLQRVFIGQGNTNYRIVYGSLLAWVNDMPQEPARSWWF